MGKIKRPLPIIFKHCLLPLFAGALVYLFFRPATVFSQLVHTTFPFVVSNRLLQQLLNSAPDFCWAYSFACACYLYRSLFSLNFVVTGIFILIILVLSEVAQVFMPHRFTFDYYDLLAHIFAFGCATRQMKNILYAERL